jgi:hypothetical protein
MLAKIKKIIDKKPKIEDEKPEKKEGFFKTFYGLWVLPLFCVHFCLNLFTFLRLRCIPIY